MSADLPTSLVSYGDRAQTVAGTAGAENGARERVSSPCRPGWWFVSESTGAMVPARCGAHGCSHCAPINARITAAAVALASPERFFTLTKVGPTWRDTRRQMHAFTQALRRRGIRWQHVYSVETNPKGTGHHLHGYQHGQYVPQADLSTLAESAGMGFRVDIRQAKFGDGSYPFKAAYGAIYGMKATKDPNQRADVLYGFLEANGGRLEHHTRGFFRDPKSGEPLTLVEARKRAGQVAGDEGPWALVRIG